MQPETRILPPQAVSRVIDSAKIHSFRPNGPILPVSEEQVFHQCGGGEDQDDEHKQPNEAHPPHHLAHVLHHWRTSFI
jgi:hypothetical protein